MASIQLQIHFSPVSIISLLVPNMFCWVLVVVVTFSRDLWLDYFTHYGTHEVHKDLVNVLAHVLDWMPPSVFPSMPSVKMGPYHVTIHSCQIEEGEADVLQIMGTEWRPTEYRLQMKNGISGIAINCTMKITSMFDDIVFEGVYNLTIAEHINITTILSTKVGKPCLSTFRYMTLQHGDIQHTEPYNPTMKPVFEAAVQPIYDAYLRMCSNWEDNGANAPITDQMCHNLYKISRLEEFS